GASVAYGVYEGTGTNVYVADPEKGAARIIARLERSPGSFEMPSWDPDGKWLYLRADSALWRISVSGDETKELRVPGRRIVKRSSEPNGLTWRAAGDGSVVVVTHDDVAKQSGFYKVDFVTGQSVKLL